MGDRLLDPGDHRKQPAPGGGGQNPGFGGGYGGPFAGPGFDGMWTDMSEIVRPTRDGIHGRELHQHGSGIRPCFPARSLYAQPGSGDQEVLSACPRVEISVPFLFDLLPFREFPQPVLAAMARAAKETNTLMILPAESVAGELSSWMAHLVPLLPPGNLDRFIPLIQQCRMVQISPDRKNTGKACRDQENPSRGDRVGSSSPDPPGGGGGRTNVPGRCRSNPYSRRWEGREQATSSHGSSRTAFERSTSPGKARTPGQRSASSSGAGSPWPSTWPKAIICGRTRFP